MALDKKTLNELEQKLRTEKSRLKKELEKIAEPTDSAGDYEAKFENIGEESDENATEVNIYANKLALENNLERQLKDANDALAKMKKETYGICEECGGEINIERLKIHPAARRCMKCSERS